MLEIHHRHRLEVTQDWRVCACRSHFLQVGSDEEIVLQKLLKTQSVRPIPGQQLQYEFSDLFIFNVIYYNFIDFLLPVVFNPDCSLGEKSQPDPSDVPYQLTLGVLMVFVLFWVVEVISYLFLLGSIADDMPEPPDSFLFDYVWKLNLRGNDQIHSQMNQSICDAVDSLYGLLGVVSTGFKVLQRNVALLFVRKNAGFIGTLEEIEQLLMVKRQVHQFFIQNYYNYQ